MRQTGRAHLKPLLLIAALTLLWTWPLPLYMRTHIPGDPGDNFSFLWNLWWMRRVLESVDLEFFHSGFLFFPFGVDLVNHPHTALQGAIAATALSRLSIIEAENLIILVSVFANAAAAYALVIDITGHRRAGMLAAVIFGGSPYISAHLLGHFDLLSAWVLPVFALCLRRALRDGSRTGAILCGLTMGVASYAAYYYVVYLGLFTVVYVVTWWQCVSFSIERRFETPVVVGLRRVLLALLLLDFIVVLWVVTTGGGVLRLSRVMISVQKVQNPLTAGWLLLLTAALTLWRPRLHVRVPPRELLQRGARALAWTSLIFAICAGPLIVEAASLGWQRRYVSPMYFWRSAPRGVDIVAGLSGNPFHPLTGAVAGRVYEAAHLDPIEGVAWLGVVPVVLMLGPRRRWTDRREAGCWLAVLAVSALWALGPFATVGGFDIGLPLPQALMRFVPVVANARMPGRAMVLVYLALGVLSALRLAALEKRWQKTGLWQWALVVCVVLDYLGAPIPLTRLDQPPIYARLAAIGDGQAVCELPLGIGDGLSPGVGAQDRRVLYYATLHGHPLVGGFIGRMPPGVAEAYARMPVVGDLLQLSDGKAPTHDRDAQASPPCRYLVVDRTAASSELMTYLHTLPGLERLASDNGKDLYRLQ